MNFSDLPDFSPTSVIYFSDSTFLEHVVTNSTEDFKLLLTGESICIIAS